MANLTEHADEFVMARIFEEGIVLKSPPMVMNCGSTITSRGRLHTDACGWLVILAGIELGIVGGLSEKYLQYCDFDILKQISGESGTNRRITPAQITAIANYLALRICVHGPGSMHMYGPASADSHGEINVYLFSGHYYVLVRNLDVARGYAMGKRGSYRVYSLAEDCHYASDVQYVQRLCVAPADAAQIAADEEFALRLQSLEMG